MKAKAPLARGANARPEINDTGSLAVTTSIEKATGHWEEDGNAVLSSTGWQFDPAEAWSHNSIDIWEWETPYRRNRIVANVKGVAPIWLPGDNDMDTEAMAKATVARANLFVAAPALLEAAEAALGFTTEVYRTAQGHRFTDRAGWGDWGEGVANRLRAAIAAAKGEQS